MQLSTKRLHEGLHAGIDAARAFCKLSYGLSWSELCELFPSWYWRRINWTS